MINWYNPNTNHYPNPKLCKTTAVLGCYRAGSRVSQGRFSNKITWTYFISFCLNFILFHIIHFILFYLFHLGAYNTSFILFHSFYFNSFYLLHFITNSILFILRAYISIYLFILFYCNAPVQCAILLWACVRSLVANTIVFILIVNGLRTHSGSWQFSVL